MKPGCQPFFDRLVDGAAPSADAALADHLRTCLDCFRLQAELRDVPRIVAALRADAPADPGEAFWRSFPGDAWAAAEVEAARPTERAPALFDRFVAWFVRPLPAAFAGAACAATVVLVIATHPPTHAPARVDRPSPAFSTAGKTDDVVLAPTDLDELDGPALRAVLDSLAGESDEADGFARAVTDDAGDLTAVQEIQALDTESLRALAVDLQKVPI